MSCFTAHCVQTPPCVERSSVHLPKTKWCWYVFPPPTRPLGSKEQVDAWERGWAHGWVGEEGGGWGGAPLVDCASLSFAPSADLFAGNGPTYVTLLSAACAPSPPNYAGGGQMRCRHCSEDAYV
jgi:hypothetical protein